MNCTCEDLEERLARLNDISNLAIRTCKKCDKHYAVCKCKEPDWGVKIGGKFQ